MEKSSDSLDGIYNDHTPLDESDSSSDDFWPKMRKNVDNDGNALHAISSIMDGDFDNVTDDSVYVGPKCNKPNPTFDPRIDVEKGKMVLVRLGNKDEGEMTWMEKTISDIFQDDDNDTLHIKIDCSQPSSRKYKGKNLEQYWVANPDGTGTKLGSIPINTIV